MTCTGIAVLTEEEQKMYNWNYRLQLLKQTLKKVEENNDRYLLITMYVLFVNSVSYDGFIFPSSETNIEILRRFERQRSAIMNADNIDNKYDIYEFDTPLSGVLMQYKAIKGL